MSAAQFYQFNRLPAELQDLVWQHALPEPRVYEVFDAPAPSIPRSDPANHLLFADIRNERPPAIGTVCHGARNAVMRRYRPVVLSGTVKFLDLTRDVLLLDSYLQVRRLLKAIRLLSQVDVIRKHISQIALGTSWGLHAGLQLRLFHRTVQTKRNMTRLLKHLAQFTKLEAVVLVVYQRSAFSLQVQWLDQRCFAWTPSAPPPAASVSTLPWHQQHPSAPRTMGPEPAQPTPRMQNQPGYHYNFHVNFNLDNYWLRRPCHSSLEEYVVDEDEEQEVLGRKHSKILSEPAGRSETCIGTKDPDSTNMMSLPASRYGAQIAGAGGPVALPAIPAKVPAAATTMFFQPSQQPKQSQSRYHDPHDIQPKPHHVRALKSKFQKWVDEAAEGDGVIDGPRAAKRPRLEAATLTWVYSGISNTTVY
ncbi:2EXR family [Microdochium nivale]|nr:2EXR family [Microdochium nivale]